MVWKFAPMTGKAVKPVVCDTCFCVIEETLFNQHVMWHKKLEVK